MPDDNDFRTGDLEYSIWRKMLNRLSQLVSGGGSTVTLTASDIEIGAVELKNSTDDTRAIITTAAPGGADPGLVVRIAGGGSGDGAILDGVSAAIKATVFDYTNSNPIATQLVDANGDPVSVGGGTQYAEDTASTAGEQLTMAGVVRQDAAASLVDADGDRTELQVNSTGSLRVDGSGVTQPISAASLPLPSGAATEATLATRASEATLASIDGKIVTVDTDNVTVVGTVAVSAAALPLPAGAATEATLAALNAKVTAVNTGAVTISAALPAGNNNIGDVDVASVPAPLNVTGGGAEATALRVTVANDSTGLLSVDDNGNSLTTDTPQLPAALVGGRLDVVVGAALPAGTNNIGDVDVLTIPAPLNVTGGGAEATALRVTLANDSTGLVSVDDNGASLTVDTTQLPAALVGGRLDVVVGAALPAGTANIGDVDVLSVPAPLSTAGGGAEATALRVTLANDSTGLVSVDDNGGALTVDNGGTFLVQDSEKLTDNGAFVDGTSKVMMAGFAFDETAGTALTENDAAAARVDSKRAQVIAIEDATTRGQRLAVNSTGHASVALKPQTSGGLTNFHLASAGTTNATNLKATPGQVFGWYIYNSNSSARKVAFHNTAGTPTAGASIFFSLVIPPSSGANVFSEQGIEFSAGIAITTVTGLADSDSAAVASNDLIINVWFK